MAGKTSFYYAIFKKLQASDGSGLFYDSGHSSEDPPEMSGGFSLKYPDHPNGLFGSLGPKAGTFGYGIQPGWKPLGASTDPNQSPLFKMLEASLTPSPPPTVTVNGQQWPVMPLGGTTGPWPTFNSGPVRLLDKFSEWIAAGQPNDTPKPPKLRYQTWIVNAPPAWPGLPSPYPNAMPLLFVASNWPDDGRRHGDGGMPDVALDHVPAKFWATAQIFLTKPTGDSAAPAQLKGGEEYYVVALLANVGNAHGGQLAGSLPNIHVRCEAQAFNTFMSPGTPLPSLGNLDPAVDDPTYEVYGLRKGAWDIAGFRFDVSSVFQRLETALANSNMNLGGLTPAQWLADSHPCVKVRIMSGENPLPAAPSHAAAPALDANPRLDRHIAQRNLAPFGIPMAPKPPSWKTFVVSQAGKGGNTLLLEHGLPLDAFDVHVAVTRHAWEQYVAKTPGLAGFEPVREAPKTRPFPECVILRQVAKEAHLPVAPHEREPFIGLAIGISAKAARERPARLGSLSVVHLDGHRAVAGGFTLELSDEKAPLR